MFHNTTAGNYLRKKDGLKTSYTFPKDASFLIGNIFIPLGNITVECYGGAFDAITIQQFNEAVSMIKSENCNNYNSSIFITDQQLQRIEYPSRDVFNSNNIEYMEHKDFHLLQNQVKEMAANYEMILLHTKMVKFLKQANSEMIQSAKDKINIIINNDYHFPKNISIIYDDRINKHTIHAVLSFKNPTECVLIIDNTLSPLHTCVGGNLLEQVRLKIDPVKCKEVVSGKSIELYADNIKQRPDFTLKLDRDVNEIFMTTIYTSMSDNIRKLGYNIIDVVISHSAYNQKNTVDCVPFSMQNKLEFIRDNKIHYSNESANQMSVRIRAEQAILLYLISGSDQVLRLSEMDAKERNVTYNVHDWYPNYFLVCKQIDEKINNLSCDDLIKLSKLYNGPENKLSSKFIDMIKQKVMDKSVSLATSKLTLLPANQQVINSSEDLKISTFTMSNK